jgi:hypothetical protein
MTAKHYYKDRIILDLEYEEFILIAYLIEKNSQKMKQNNVVKEPISVKINVELQKFISEELV